MTNREYHEEAAGMALDNLFFIYNDIDPDADFIPPNPKFTGGEALRSDELLGGPNRSNDHVLGDKWNK